jgi:outer membrane protein assembly factor BamB
MKKTYDIETLVERAFPAEGLKTGPKDLARLRKAISGKRVNGVHLSFKAIPSVLIALAAMVLFVFLFRPLSFTVDSTVGTVKMSDGRLAVPGDRLRRGDGLVTGASGQAWFRIGRNLFHLPPASSVRIGSVHASPFGRSARVELLAGRMFGNFEDHRHLKSLTIISGPEKISIRGTVFMVSPDSVAVLKGLVSVRSRGLRESVGAREVLRCSTGEKKDLTDVSSFDSVLDFFKNHPAMGSAEVSGWNGLQIASDPDRIYVCAEDGRIAALSRDNGGIIWSSEVQAKVTAVPAVDASSLYVNSSSGDLFVLDKTSGRIRSRLGFGPFAYSSPLVSEGVLYAGNTKGRVIALAGDRILWSADLGEGIYSTPVREGRSLYVATLNGRLTRLDAESGRVVWTKSVGGRMLDTSLAVGENGIYAFAESQEGSRLIRFEADSGRRVWSREFSAAPSGPIGIRDGSILIRADGLRILAMDGVETGRFPGKEISFLDTPDGLVADRGARVEYLRQDGARKLCYVKDPRVRLFAAGNRLLSYDGRTINLIDIK